MKDDGLLISKNEFPETRIEYGLDDDFICSFDNRNYEEKSIIKLIILYFKKDKDDHKEKYRLIANTTIRDVPFTTSNIELAKIILEQEKKFMNAFDNYLENCGNINFQNKKFDRKPDLETLKQIIFQLDNPSFFDNLFI